MSGHSWSLYINIIIVMKLTCSKGRQLSEITFGSKTAEDKSDDKTIEYTYNENSLRTFKKITDNSGEKPITTSTINRRKIC